MTKPETKTVLGRTIDELVKFRLAPPGTITVNGAVFKQEESLGRGWLYVNGETRLFRDVDSGTWTAGVGRSKWSRQWVHETPEDALRDLANEASSWAPVLAELARLGMAELEVVE